MGKRTHGPYLLAAIEYNDIEKVSHILATKFRDKSKVKVFLTSEVRRLASEYTEVPLILSATLNDPTIIRYFITKHDVNVNFAYEYGAPGQRRRKTALLVAVRRGHYATVDALLSLNADANTADHKSRTALHHAVRRADYRMAKLLLARGAITSLCDAAGNTALHVASIFGHSEMCRLLLRHSADLYKKGQLGALPVHMAAREGHAALVKMYITMYEVNADIRVPCYGDREQSPIHVAASQGHHETVFVLLEQCGADVNARDSEGETPLHCSVVNEYDPLGMKSKDDYTETAKILLNFGAEVNLRNARGETPLHLAARNEFQKVLEVLLLAGCDPSIEDNDKNKAIDLVDENDAVSKQILKNALADRERLFNESREIRSKGFSTSLQRELPLSMRSQSTLNVQLLAGMHGAAAASRYTSHTGLFQPNLSMQYPPTLGGGMSGGPMNLSLGYIPGAVGMAHYAAPVGTGSGGNHSGSRTGSSSNGSFGNILQAAPRHPESAMHGAMSVAALSGYPPRGPATMASPLRKVRSVEELDQPRTRHHGASKGSGGRKRRDRKSSYQESETSSFWAVTPPASVQYDNDEPDVQSPVTAAPVKFGKQVPPAVVPKKPTTKPKIYENEEETRINAVEKVKQPLQFVSAKKAAAAAGENGDENDDYYLDDDSSVDMLELDDEKPRKKKDKNKFKSSGQAPLLTAAPRQMVPPKNEPVVKKKAVESWVDEQTRIVKERQIVLEAEKPVAHSTPPTSTKNKKHKGGKGRNKNDSSDDDDDESSETSSSSESETTESDSDISSNAPKGPPPALPKPRPMPPPKPSSSSKEPPSKKNTSGPMSAPRKTAGGSGGRQQPLFQMEEPGSDRIIQVDVDESTATGETVISIIPLQPPGPTRVQKVPTGVETSTYLSLSRSGTPKLDESTSSKTKKPTPAPLDGKTSKHRQDAANEGPRPVARPRETKKTEVLSASAGHAERRVSDTSDRKATKKNPKRSQNKSDSSTDFSDEDHEESFAQAAASKTTYRSTPTNGLDRESPFPKPQSSKPTTQQKAPGSAFAAAKMIFQKASTNDSITDADHRSISLGDVTMSTSATLPQPAPQPRKLSDQDLSSSVASGKATVPTQPLLNTSSRLNQPQQPLKPVLPVANNRTQREQQPAAAESSESSQDDSDDSDDSEPNTDDFRTVKYCSVDQSLGFTLAGGNVKGVFADAVDATSAAALGGLRVGDQLLCVDNRPVFGKTREEVIQMVRTSMSAGGTQTSTSLLVRHKPNLMRTVMESGGGDSLNVRAHFIYDATRRGELTVNNGDVFAVSDTLPDGSAGFWRAKKIDLGGRKDGDFSAIGSGSSSPEGLVPNKSKADQIVVRDLLAQGKSGQSQQRGTTFFRSFRRSKSVGRNGVTEEDDAQASSGDVVSYERVVQKVAEFHRPVVVLGLFCDTVRTMLISDASSKFIAPVGEVETKDATSSDPTVDVKPITAVPSNRHCVLIMSPPGIEYLQQHTDLNPIVIYISPVSKNVVKVVKAKLAPTYNKNPGFMYDEAARFEKNYAHLFSAVVPYTTNDEWYHNLRDAIDYLQNQPTWIAIPPAELDAAAQAEAAKIMPLRMMKQLAAETAVAARRGTGNAVSSRPVSRTTDDLPQEYNSQQKKVSAGTGRKLTPDMAQQKSVDLTLNGTSNPVGVEDGRGTMTSRAQTTADTTTVKSTIPTKSRTQSSSSTLDRQQQPPSSASVATLPAISAVAGRSRMIAASQSHETQL